MKPAHVFAMFAAGCLGWTVLLVVARVLPPETIFLGVVLIALAGGLFATGRVFRFWGFAFCLALVLPLVAAAGGTPAPEVDALLSNPLASLRALIAAVRDGNYWLAGALLLFAVVGALRSAGKRAHDAIPDDTTHFFLAPLERVLWFLFDTKIGGWVLNWITTIAGCLGFAYLGGLPVDGAAWKSAVLFSTTGTMLIELWDDIREWLDSTLNPTGLRIRAVLVALKLMPARDQLPPAPTA